MKAMMRDDDIRAMLADGMKPAEIAVELVDREDAAGKFECQSEYETALLRYWARARQLVANPYQRLAA